jgi:hypothetical protein
MSAPLIAALLMLPGQEVILPRIHNPTVNLSAVRPITCDEGSGTGFVIDYNKLVTALHVADDTNCVDAETGVTLTTYHKDEKHDLAIMEGKYPVGGPYIKYSCEPYRTGRRYVSLGYRHMFRMDTLTASPGYTGPGYLVGGKPYPGMRLLLGGIVFGMSGGPIVDPETGYAHGLNNVASWNNEGKIVKAYSYEFKDTALCKA